MAAVAAAVAVATLPALVGYESYLVHGDSMGAALPAGSVAVTSPTRADDLQVGDVIARRDGAEQSPPVLHRIVAVEGIGPSFTTRGDANPGADPTPLRPDGTVDRVVYRLPLIGHLVTAARTGPGQLLLIGLPVTVAGIGLLPRIRGLDGFRVGRAGQLLSGRAPAVVFFLGVVPLLAWIGSERALTAFTDQAGVGANSLTTDTLDPPSGVVASGTGPVTVDWTATPDTYATGHRVLRATASGGPYTQIAEVTPRATVTYDDSPGAGTYYYVVRSFYSDWESTDSNEVSATVGSSSIVLDNATSGGASGFSAVTSTSFSHALSSGSGTDRVLIVNVAHEDANVTDVTYDGVAMTAVASETSQSFARSTMYIMTDGDLPATAGSYTVEITFATAANGTAGSVSFTGVDQTTPHDTAVTASGSTGTPSLAVSSEVGDVVVDTYAWREPENLDEGTGMTENHAAAGREPANGSSRADGAASVTMDYTSPGLNSKNWSQIAINLNAAP